jgi:dTDP-glucose 4,6-dehydratase
VTGSAGFIFSNFIIYALQETDWELVSIDKLTYAGSLLNVPPARRHKMYLGDVCDAHFINKVFDLEKPDVVVHGAAESMVDRSINNSAAFIQTNVTGTQVMLDAARRLNVSKFINVSSDEVYGCLEIGSATEASPLKPRNPYAASKAAADLLGQSYFHTHGMPIITTRSSNNLGPRQHPEKLIPKAITLALNNQPIPLFGSGLNVRDWIYTKDKYNAIKLLIEKGVPGEAYNIGAGHEKTNLEVLKFILNELDRPETLIQYIPDRPGHDLRYSVDCSKLQALGWKAQYPFEEALRHTIGWYKANGSWFWKKGV